MGSRDPAPGRAGRLIAAMRARPAVSLLVIVGLAAAVLVAFLVFGGGERSELMATVEGVREGVVEGDVEAVMHYISPYFYEEGMDREELHGRLRGALQYKPVSRASVQVRQVEWSSRRRARAVLHVESYHGPALRGRGATSQWLVEFDRGDGRWLVRSASPLEVDRRRAAGLRSIFALAR